MANPLPTYLRTYRKQHGFTQEDIAFLVGLKSGTPISRYERAVRTPNLDTTLACQFIFAATTNELFPGHMRRIIRRLHRRAKVLRGMLRARRRTPLVEQKLRALDTIITSIEEYDR